MFEMYRTKQKIIQNHEYLIFIFPQNTCTITNLLHGIAKWQIGLHGKTVKFVVCV